MHRRLSPSKYFVSNLSQFSFFCRFSQILNLYSGYPTHCFSFFEPMIARCSESLRNFHFRVMKFAFSSQCFFFNHITFRSCHEIFEKFSQYLALLESFRIFLSYFDRRHLFPSSAFVSIVGICFHRRRLFPSSAFVSIIGICFHRRYLFPSSTFVSIVDICFHRRCLFPSSAFVSIVGICFHHRHSNSDKHFLVETVI